MNVVAVFLIGVVVLFGLIWQALLIFIKYREPKTPQTKYCDRLFPMILIGDVVLLGTIVYGILCACDARRTDFTGAIFLSWVLKAMVFLIVIITLGYFGPLVVVFALSWEIYFWLEYGHLESLPILTPFVTWVFVPTEDWQPAAYVVFQCLYCLISSIIDFLTFRARQKL